MKKFILSNTGITFQLIVVLTGLLIAYNTATGADIINTANSGDRLFVLILIAALIIESATILIKSVKLRVSNKHNG